MDIKDISNFSLLLCFLLLLIPIVLSKLLQLKIIKAVLNSAIRMSIQLFLMAIFLTYLFEWNLNVVNVIWFVIMIIVATFSVIKSSHLDLKIFLLPIFMSLMLSTLFIILYFNKLILSLQNVLEAKYLIVIGGMILGNSLRGNIIGLSNFYKDIKRNEERYLYNLSLGATIIEAIIPYFRKSIISALNPMIATMATMGIVILPGMMTGQILGGATPITAIKYQIAIMIAIFASVAMTVTLTILFTIKSSFDDFSILKQKIFKEK